MSPLDGLTLGAAAHVEDGGTARVCRRPRQRRVDIILPEGHAPNDPQRGCGVARIGEVLGRCHRAIAIRCTGERHRGSTWHAIRRRGVSRHSRARRATRAHKWLH
eukprot:4658764-Prymnesium_polylepis.1